jgi:EmrB/QacA subfamily drug resistance transporter
VTGTGLVTETATKNVRKGLVLAILGVCFLVVMMDNTILNVALQTLQQSLDATNSQLQWSVDSYILVYAALMFFAGVLADSYGRRRMLVIGLLIFGVASALSAYSGTPDQLILWRAVMGLGGAVVPAATLATIKHVFPPSEQGKAMGVWAALGGLSVAFGPIIGGALLARFWWGSVFLINVPVVVVVVALMLIFVPETRAPRRPKMDIVGVLLSITATGAVVYGVIQGGETNHWMSVGALGAVLAGVVLAVILVFVERRQVDPALDVTLFRSGPFTAGTLSISLSFFALTGGTFLLVFYVQLVRGYHPLQLGLVLLPVAIGSVISAISGAGLVAKRGARLVVVTGLVLLVISLLGLFRIGAATNLWVLELILFAAGLGMGLVMSTTTTLAMSVVGPQKSGAGAAVNNTIRQIGAALGVAVMGSVYSIQYRANLGSTLSALHIPLPSAASDSLSGTLLAAQDLLHDPRTAQLVAPAIPGVLDQAKAAFVSAMHTSVLIAAIVLAVAIALAAIWLPGRNIAAATANATSREEKTNDTADSVAGAT